MVGNSGKRYSKGVFDDSIAELYEQRLNTELHLVTKPKKQSETWFHVLTEGF
jgi:hypothetical protein